ncbi:MAG TPA: ATP-binding protein [Solirubrobacteraceae bacterium]|nr:ATP-binding protein [Solirubrobacteraceae bacterium]
MALPAVLRRRWRRLVRGCASWLSRLPIRVRLTLPFAALMAVLFGGLGVALHDRFADSLDQGIDHALRTRAADLSSLVEAHDLSRLVVNPSPSDSAGAYAQILDARGRVVDATLGHAHGPLLTPEEVRAALRRPVLVDRRDDLRIVGRALQVRPRAVLAVAGSLEQHDRALTTLGELMFIGGPILLVITCMAGYVLADRALAPVERMRARAASISGARGERLPVPAARDELQRLGETLNEMLARLEDALDRERQFVENAGHELRTPLSILKLELELALSGDSTREELTDALRSTTEEVDRLARLAEDMLVVARAGSGRLPVHRLALDVDGTMRVVADRFEQAARSRGREVVVDGRSGLVISADPGRIEQALTNMVANALRHGGGPVTVAARARRDRVEMHVLDEGCGFEPSFLPHAFDRSARSTAPGAGAGLGLSIVRAIAEAHGGEAGAANRRERGADVWLSLPR